MSRICSMIRIWFLAISLLASLIGSPAFAQGTTVVRIDPSTLSVQANNTFNILVKVDNVSNLAAFEIHLAFNPAVLEVTSMTNGGFVAADIAVQNIFDNQLGTIDYAVAQMNRPTAEGNGILLNISFHSKANGSSMVTTRSTPTTSDGLLLVNPDGLVISTSWAGGNIDVGTSQSTTATPIIPTLGSTPTFTSVPPNTPTFTATSPSPTIVTPTNTTPTFTPSPTPAVTPTQSPTTPSNSQVLGIHVVRWGEWLYCIGRAYRVSPWAIVDVNHIWWPYIIFPNQQLIIPNVPWINMTAGPVCQAQFSAVPSTQVPSSTPKPPVGTPIPPTATPLPPATNTPFMNCRATYVVQPGDTLYGIALRYGTTYADLARVNQISNPRLIHPGQRLCIP